MQKRQNAKRAKKQGICPYCGKIGQLSEDHVIPRCLFAGSCPGDIPKVFACAFCNNSVKSANDAYLRDMLFTDMHTTQHPDVQQLWEKFARSIDSNRSEVAKEAHFNSQLVSLHTFSGIFRGWAYEVKLNPKRTTSLFGMITRGLYQCYVGRRLPQDTQFDVMRIQDDLRPFETTVQILLQQGAPFVSVGDGQVFKCIYAYGLAHPEVSLWFLCFYESVVFSVVTNRQIYKHIQSD